MSDTQGAWVEPAPRKRKEKSDNKAATAIVVATKFTKLLKVFKTAKIMQPLITFGSMIASVGIYAISLGWAFALGLVAMLFVHEMGHVLAFKRKGMKVSAPLFIPMLGAVVFAPGLADCDRDTEAYAGYGGPLIGSLAALPLMLAVIFFDVPELVVLTAYVAVVINLFNLIIPIRPLDGGRITQAVGPWFKYAGVGILVAITFLLASPGFLLIWLLVLGDFRMEAKLRYRLSIVIWVTMIGLLATGIGHDQHWLISAFDAVFGLFFVYMNKWWVKIVTRDGFDTKAPMEKDDRPHLIANRRWFWLAMWLALTVALIVSLVLVHPHLPVEAQ